MKVEHLVRSYVGWIEVLVFVMGASGVGAVTFNDNVIINSNLTVKIDATVNTNLIVNGKVGIGVSSPTSRLEVGGRIRVRRGADPTAGVYLMNANSTSNLALMGMSDDTNVGFYGYSGAGWGLLMNVSNGTVTIKGRLNANGVGITNIGSAAIANGSVSNVDLANGSVSTAKLDLVSVDGRYVNVTGDTMMGPLTLNGSGNALIVGSGNVGIGTSNPGSKLEVNGNIQLSENAQNSGKRIGTPGAVQNDQCGSAIEFYKEADNSDILKFITHWAGTNTGERMRITKEGNVGIGTSNPGSKLEVNGNIQLSENTRSSGKRIGTPGAAQNDQGGSAIEFYKEADNSDILKFITHWAGTNTGERMRITKEGNVGIGTMNPQKKVDVDWGDLIVQGIGSFDAWGEEGGVYLGDVNHYIKGVHGFGVKIGTYGVGDVISIRQASGKVGIGTTTPEAKLHVVATSGYAGYFSSAEDHGDLCLGGAVGRINSDPTNQNSNIIISSNNDIELRLDNDGGENGTFYIVNSGGYRVCTVNEAGKLALYSASGVKTVEMGTGLDYAEGFNVSDVTAKPDPGTVLVIDAEHPGKLVASRMPYDTRVAGIVAGANRLGSGVKLGSGQFDVDVALAGRVYCNVDTCYGGVQPGDLLTTSPTAGHAMVVRDPTSAQGAILGKAMEAMPAGKQGQILVLVTLQ